MPLATDAYLADTTHLTTLQHGIYLKLLIVAWRTPGRPRLPNDDVLLARYAGLDPRSWRANRETIMAFWDLSADGFWTQKKQLKVREIVSKKSADAKEKAARRWGAKPLEYNESTDAGAMPEACRDDAIQNQTLLREIEEPNGSLSEPPVSDAPQPRKRRREYPLDFEAVWKAYPTRVNNSKSQALVEWRKLTPDERATVLPSLSGFAGYCKANPDYKPIHLERYLKFRRFEGFLTPHQGDDGQGTDWQTRLAFGRTHQTWSTARWGPAPGQSGCLVPEALLVDGDGANWIEWTGLQAVGSN